MVSNNLALVSADYQHTGTNIGKEIVATCNKWGIDVNTVRKLSELSFYEDNLTLSSYFQNVISITTDGASNMQKAIADEMPSHVVHVKCLAHTLDLVAKAADGNEEMKSIVAKLKAVIRFFKKSGPAGIALRERNASLKLKQSVNTRWNSTFLMVERYLHLQEDVEAAILGLVGNVRPPLVPDILETNALKDLVDLMAPFIVATQELSTETTMTVGKVIPLIRNLRITLNQKNPTTTCVQRIKRAMLKQLDDRYPGNNGMTN